MRKLNLIIVAMVLLLGLGIAQAKDFEITKKAGDLTVVVKIDKNPPVTGTNKMDIALKDAAGKNVTDASVIVEYGMPAMPGMGAMNYKTNATLKGSNYLATVNFSMSGAWNVNIKINRGGKTQTVKLNVDIK
ncbi:MAG TPA: FixH family protein [Smithella sp.]|nr:FixH family protein [Smithella sp.]MDM7988118.1 FixH family protein [Smithella sp.]HNY49180.1 FixH family protein [Smithella sp.]HOG90056.1 FixH family protein [Smithella sp.]HOU49626.1 FixH family protein [Smithella sp.]